MEPSEPAKPAEKKPGNPVSKLFVEVGEIKKMIARRDQEDRERRHAEELKAGKRSSLLTGLCLGVMCAFAVWFFFGLKM